MLVAKNRNGEWFSLAENHNPHTLKKIRQKEVYFCPECQEEVILKVGSKRIAHFAHKKGSLCHEGYERESEYHLNGKLLLYNWFKEQGLSPKLEPYYKEILQRPDIGLTYNGSSYAIEYQCSVIPEEIFIKRTENYHRVGITPIWIMAGKNIKRKGHNKISLSGFDYLFLRKSLSDTWMLQAFCPVTKTFITIHQLLPISAKNAFARFTLKDFTAAALTDFFTPNLYTQIKPEDWQKEMKRSKDSAAIGYGGFKSKFLQELYSHSLIPSLLPPEIGLPLHHSIFIETSPIKWQSFLFMDVLKTGEMISEKQMISSFKKRVRKGDIKIRSLPLILKGDEILAIKEYMNLLIKLKIFTPADKGMYKKIRPVFIAENQIQQLEMERKFYEQNGRIVMSNVNKI